MVADRAATGRPEKLLPGLEVLKKSMILKAFQETIPWIQTGRQDLE